MEELAIYYLPFVPFLLPLDEFKSASRKLVQNIVKYEKSNVLITELKEGQESEEFIASLQIFDDTERFEGAKFNQMFADDYNIYYQACILPIQHKTVNII